ncbi:MAG: asparagine synthase (glutamine-hydrolyzing) [Patescibacteria group bacterium]
MCGISGVYHFGNSKTVNVKDVVKMQDTLIHRGPDGGADYISPNKKVGLSQRRLAIIDLSKEAACPMTNEKGNVWITYNGEIYNFESVKEELVKKGYKFKTQGDTEVILYGYEEWGPDVVKKLNGMFAFVIWDEENNVLFAARDHMGVKPFFYSVQNETFYFGSEIKAILAHPDFKKELNEVGVFHYLTFSSTPAPHTLFKDVQKLEAAHYLLIRNGKIETKEYWSPVNGEGENLNESQYIERVRSLLEDSVRSQMVSDVPFGCFLSGGIDSSTNAALMSKALGKPVETFSVGYKNFDEKNEFQYSRMMAKELGAKNHEILLDESHMRKFLDEYAHYADDPNGDQVCFPLFWLSKLTKDNGVTVIQIGEGADELFAGYETYLKAIRLRETVWDKLGALPDFLKKSLQAGKWMFNDFQREYIRRLVLNQEPFWGLATAFGGEMKCDLLTEGFKKKQSKSSYEVVKHRYDEIRAVDPKADYLKQMTYFELKHRLPEFLLARADKMTMAHSVEGRVPFLDKRLVELAFNMPTDIKIKGGNTKHILKKAVEGIIPQEIIDRKKQGFGNPIGEWLKPGNPISKELTDIIFNSNLRKQDILNYEYVKKIIHDHQHRNTDNGFKIWNLITLSLWYDYWFKV